MIEFKQLNVLFSIGSKCIAVTWTGQCRECSYWRTDIPWRMNFFSVCVGNIFSKRRMAAGYSCPSCQNPRDWVIGYFI